MEATPRFAVRRATAADAQAVVRAWHAMRLEAGFSDEELVPDWAARLGAFFAAHLTEGGAALWLAESGGALAGTTLALLKDDYPYVLFTPGRYGFIGCVYTAPEYRRQGVATELVRRAVGWLREQGARRVRLLPTAASRSMYERMGFRPVEDLDLVLPL